MYRHFSDITYAYVNRPYWVQRLFFMNTVTWHLSRWQWMSFRVSPSVSLHLININFCLILTLLCHSLLALSGEQFSLASHDCFTALMIKYGHHHYLSRGDVFINYIKLCRQYSIIKIIHQILNTLQLVSAKINQLQYKISSVSLHRADTYYWWCR